ncbi:MAG: OmpA family protein [Deltaproteobacteria bacterium]
MRFLLGIIVLNILSINGLEGQGKIIKLKNPSFEGNSAAGDNTYFKLLNWTDCARFIFPDETSPDIHSSESNHFEVRHEPFDGNTYLGLVTREVRETYEMVSQQLESPLQANRCYKFSIYLAKSVDYISAFDGSKIEKNFNNPVKLRIWGCLTSCSKTQLLAESPLVDHSDWKQYNFKFKPNRNYNYIMLEAFYKTPVLLPYNGNIILDKASDIIEIPCPAVKEIAKVVVKKPEAAKKPELVNKSSQPAIKKPAQTSGTKKSDDSVHTNTNGNKKPNKKDKILKDLEKDKIVIGQTIRIEKLYFDADSSNVNPQSFEVLNEIHEFLEENPNVIIEIGGHTNGVPGEDYCNKLSTERAKKVAEFLYGKGIPTFRIKYRGYGKLQPLASDQTAEGRRKNQRVEIKILYIGNKSI